MTLGIIGQMLIYGLITGALYAVAAVGLALVFGVMNIANISVGSLLVVGGYLTFYLFQVLHLDPFLSIPLVAFILFLLGLVIYKIMFSRVSKLKDIKEKLNTSMLLGFGLILLLDNAVLFTYSTQDRSISTAYTGKAFPFFGLSLPFVGILGMFLSLLIILIVYLFLSKTYFGKAIAATSEDWQAASTMGIHIERTYMFSFALGVALAGIAGSILITNFAISPAISIEWLLRATIVVVLAGMGNIWGTLVAGLMLGVFERIGVLVMGVPYREFISLILFLLVLIIRPEGLFTKKRGGI